MNETIEVILIGFGFSIAIILLACWKINTKYKEYEDKE